MNLLKTMCEVIAFLKLGRMKHACHVDPPAGHGKKTMKTERKLR